MKDNLTKRNCHKCRQNTS